MLGADSTAGKSAPLPPHVEALVPRHIAWRRQYDANRYARHLSEPELNARIRDIVFNLLRVNRDGKLGAGPVTEEVAIWLEKLTHVLEEMQLRHGPYPAGFTRDILHSTPFPNFGSDRVQNAAKRMSQIQLEARSAFIRFGKREHMESLYTRGALRVQSATYFANPAHNGAVRDNELSLRLSIVLSREDVLKVVKNPEDVPIDAGDQRVDATFSLPTDYWLYCLTESIEPRLFEDFDADSCVIIRDRNRFSAMLREASASLFQGITMREGRAVYADPLVPPTTDISVPLVKHFGYSYQQEYRFYWVPRKLAKRLSHVDLEVGSLKTFSELVVL